MINSTYNTHKDKMDTSRPSSQKQYNPPRTFTDEVMAMILKDIARGSPKKYAAEANGISERHFHLSIAQGVTDIDYGENDTRWARMVLSLRSIEMEEIIRCRQNIIDNEKGHKGAEWTLEHAYWREFCGDAKIIQLAEEVDELKVEKNSEKESQKG